MIKRFTLSGDNNPIIFIENTLAAAPLQPALEAVSGNFVLSNAEDGDIVHFNGLSSDSTFTIPAGLTLRTVVIANRDSSFNVTIVDSAVSLTSPDGLVIEPGSIATLIHFGNDFYVAGGKLIE